MVGGDPRQAALARLLADDGHTVHTFAMERGEGVRCQPSLEGIALADCVILPLPAVGEGGRLNAPMCGDPPRLETVLDVLVPGQLLCAGMVSAQLRTMAEERGLLLRDYFAREELAVANAVPTAEGAVQLAMEQKGERIACLEMRRHYAWYLKGVPYASYWKGQISQLQTADDVYRVTAGIQRDLN